MIFVFVSPVSRIIERDCISRRLSNAHVAHTHPPTYILSFYSSNNVQATNGFVQKTYLPTVRDSAPLWKQRDEALRVIVVDGNAAASAMPIELQP